VRGLSERERLRDLFGRYLSRQVSEVVLAGQVTLEGERRNVTVLFCDVRGSTTFAEVHAPEEVMAALNQYFEVVISSTGAYGGIVNGFLGDGALCIFGAPIERRDHAECAAQAALSMRAGLGALSQRRAAAGLPTLKFGIGLNSGAVIAGATGSEERQEYTVIGDTVNLGARIGDLNKIYPDHDILLSEFTRAALGTQARQYTFADLGEIQIRGKSQVVRVFALID
jgi:adenylate cyclase